MNAVAASATAMNAVAKSATAMNAVAASATARSAVRNSSTAWGIVAGSNMAIGKFVAGEAGLNPADYADMDAVAASATAMNAVAASATAMNAVAKSATARSAIVTSQYLQSNLSNIRAACENTAFFTKYGAVKSPNLVGSKSGSYPATIPANYIIILTSWYASCSSASVTARHGQDTSRIVFSDSTTVAGTRTATGVLIGGGYFVSSDSCSIEVSFTFDAYQAI